MAGKKDKTGHQRQGGQAGQRRQGRQDRRLRGRGEAEEGGQGSRQGGKGTVAAEPAAARRSRHVRPDEQAALAAVVRQSRQSRHDGALSRALPQLRPHPRGAAVGQADHRHRPDRLRPLALQPPSPRTRQARARGHPRRPAASPSSFRSIRSRRPASGRPPRSTATSPISASSRCSTAIRSTASC